MRGHRGLASRTLCILMCVCVLQVANLVCSMSNNEDGVKMVRHAAGQIEALCPQVGMGCVTTYKGVRRRLTPVLAGLCLVTRFLYKFI